LLEYEKPTATGDSTKTTLAAVMSTSINILRNEKWIEVMILKYPDHMKLSQSKMIL
jgi:hypothetical protein